MKNKEKKVRLFPTQKRFGILVIYKQKKERKKKMKKTFYLIIPEPTIPLNEIAKGLFSQGYRDGYGGDFTFCNQAKAKCIEEHIEEYENMYDVCYLFIFGLLNDDKKNTTSSKEFYEYFAEKCSDKNVFSANYTEDTEVFIKYLIVLMEEIDKQMRKSKKGKELLTDAERSLDCEYNQFKDMYLRFPSETVFNGAYEIAKMKELHECLSSMIRQEDERSEWIATYEIAHGTLLRDLAGYERGYDVNMWANWDDISSMLDDYICVSHGERYAWT